MMTEQLGPPGAVLFVLRVACFLLVSVRAPLRPLVLVVVVVFWLVRFVLVFFGFLW